MNISEQDYKKHSGLIQKALVELKNPSQSMTETYLKVFTFKKDDLENLLVARVAIGHPGNPDLSVVYFAGEHYRLFFAVYFKNDSICGVDIQSGHQVDLTATSKSLNSSELIHYVPNLNIVTEWSKGDQCKNRDIKYKFSRISIDPNPNNAFDFEDKLNLLLDHLEQNPDGVRQLVEKSDYAAISVCKYHYIASYNAPSLSVQAMKRLSLLNLSVDVSLYVTGEAFTE